MWYSFEPTDYGLDCERNLIAKDIILLKSLRLD